MKLSFDQFTAHVKKDLAPAYLLFGEEHLLKQEALDLLRASALQAGFSERLSFNIDASFDEQSLQLARQTMSLFSEKQFLEVRIYETKLNADLRNIMLEHLENPSPLQILAIIAPKLESGEQNSAWFKTLDKKGVIVNFWPLQLGQLKQWINQRLKNLGFSIDQECANLLADRTEGNLLATAQEIEKIALLFPPGKLTVEQLMNVSIDNARFDAFDLVDASLQGDNKQIIRILQNLKQEGTEPILVLWALTRELRNLIAIARTLVGGSAMAQALNQHRVWEKRKPWIARTLKTHSLKSLQHSLKQTALIDQLIKGANPGKPWEALLQLALNLAGTQLLDTHTYAG